MHILFYYYFVMLRKTIVSFIFFVLVIQIFSNPPKCPVGSPLLFTQDSLTISSLGAIFLQAGADIKCYNYTLSAPFEQSPSIAIAVNDLQSKYSSNLFFSIKAVSSENYGIIPFVVRTQWAYTRWTKISFSFFAQSSDRLEAGYFQIDTGVLGSCCKIGKAINVFIPFANKELGDCNAVTFLSGFQIGSVLFNSTYNTPFEVQIVSTSIKSNGLSLLIQSTSATQIYSLFISYIAYSSNIPNLIAGAYTYKQYIPSSNLIGLITSDSRKPNAVIHGFNGFIVKNIGNDIQLTGRFSNGNLTFSTNSFFYYLSYGYFIFVGGQCGQCPGYSIYFNDNCIATCPPNFYLNGQTCIGCQPGEIWNGNNCVSRCNNGRSWSSFSNSCECPSPLNWNGQRCISCTNGQVWNLNDMACACPERSNWNGFVCITCYSGQIWDLSYLSCVCPSNTQWNGIECISCPNGQTWNEKQQSCQCRRGQNWNGFSCIKCQNGMVFNEASISCSCPSGYILFRGFCSVVPSCTSSQILDTSTNTCICGPNSNWNGFVCLTCSHGQVWNDKSLTCECPRGFNWNGYSCITCSPGQIWNPQSNICTCPQGSNWNGFSCVTCSAGRTWNSAVNSCVCPRGLNWSGVSCVSCDTGSNWNGFSCITCESGQVWNSLLSVCQCSNSQQWNGTSCISACRQGMININGVCSCQAGFYDLDGICTKQPTCPSGQVWNGLRCLPILCPPGTFWNGSICTTSTCIMCPAGTYYDGIKCVTNITSCPQGMKWNGRQCIASSTCPNGTYLSNGDCVPISQQCPTGMTWKNGQCTIDGNNCPETTYYSNGQCIPIQPCTSGKIWNSTVIQCVCPKDTFWNGNLCMQCSGGQIYKTNCGCICPSGTFFEGNRCTSVPVNKCASIISSVWDGNSCVCSPGYTVVGMQCACQGLAVNSTLCDRCFTKPNSTFSNGICRCNSGLVQASGQCIQPTSPPSSSLTPSCNVATYFDSQQKRCLPCSSGCLSCTDCYACTQCQPGFNLDYASSLCIETCGDGKRYTLPCDDGNNNNGDGCSADCKIEVGYICSGGSPNSKDVCSQTIPKALTFTPTGQSHLFGKIILNVQINYLPLSLIQSATDCSNRCNDILSVQVINGDKSYVSIKASYVPSTSFTFSIEIDYGREPIGVFTAQIAISPKIVQRYFSGIDVSKQAAISVNPAFLAKYTITQVKGSILQ